ncbi:hypothetical protein AB205_0104750 [Aquarana catesbeiana]|uniref:Uncharacterized protein n=1 Tax=Aquarana catesbeiana TaxID=8400 RepID=A0A2G9P2K2_AQUCT|nr:hypothetical protein AB205_0104750 [Aquarana catesbeiana]
MIFCRQNFSCRRRSFTVSAERERQSCRSISGKQRKGAYLPRKIAGLSVYRCQERTRLWKRNWWQVDRRRKK